MKPHEEKRKEADVPVRKNQLRINAGKDLQEGGGEYRNNLIEEGEGTRGIEVCLTPFLMTER